jgi:hypothetical protein
MIELNHIGESLIAEMINRSEDVKRFVVHQISSSYPDDHIADAVPELPLVNCGQLIFDGAHRVDVALPSPVDGLCFAIEAKLGKTGLTT